MLFKIINLRLLEYLKKIIRVKMGKKNLLSKTWKDIMQWLADKDFCKNVISDKKITYQNFWCNKVWRY